MSKIDRDKLRGKVLNSNKFNSETVEISGVKIEVRQTTISDRSFYMEKAMSKTGQANPLDLQVYTVIASCFYPGTNDKFFTEEDYEELSKAYTGSYIDILFETTQRLSNLDVGEAKKN